MTDAFAPPPTDEYARQLCLINRLTEPAVDQAIAWLGLPSASRGLDAGCGIGSQSYALARQLGTAGQVTGLDSSEVFLELARAASPDASTANVDFRVGSLLALPFGDDSFDWAWCKDALWPGPPKAGFMAERPTEGLRELVRVVRPGGLVALVYWSGESLLCGHPVLEARLRAEQATVIPYLAAVEPRWQVLRALGWMREAGLEQTRARTFVADLCGPLDADQRGALAQCFHMLWGTLANEISADDRAQYERLCRANSPHFVGELPGYFGFIAYTAFVGRVAA